jgi:hypothetical protein
MKKKKIIYENVIISKEIFQNPLQEVILSPFEKFNSSFALLAKEISSKKVLLYFSAALTSLVLVLLVNWVFLAVFVLSFVLGSNAFWEDYKFYLVKKDFEEDGIF